MKVLLGLVVALAVGAGAVRAGKPVVPAVFVLGDSTLDVGNNNHLPGKDVPRANVPFYGIDFPGGPMPTGRFSNGYNIADFIAKNLGFEKSPLAYLVLKSRNYLIPSALTRGVSYASAGAGILDSTNAGNNIPLSKQLIYFASTKSEMEAAWGTQKVSTLLANSFFLLGFGSNDMFQTNPKTPADVAALYAVLVSNYSAAITNLYGMGARKFGIINVGPVGCVPGVRVLNATGACNDAMNSYAVGFAALVKSALANLAPKLPGFAYSLADSFAATQASFSNPQSLGFVSSDSACCGTGRLGAEGGTLCKRNDTLCADRDAYVFWDSVHSTQRAAELGAQGLFDGPAELTTPINFKQLAYKRY
ncbi:GDSL esterase/lipase At1g71691 [Lolium perenne]|uniref:GDSL esterase/lipase At1g71691 n=1 Tax=Lolium perenne TaxID=4522 RepID=UPI0021EB4192|nr:GDSL esterase/lipase At1g71250-like [Lolium perenne]